MKDFLLLFRAGFADGPKPSPEEMQASMKQWMDWIGGIAAQNKLTDRGSSLAGGGKVVRSGNVISDGPYTEVKEILGGYTIVKADSLEEAAALSENCPILHIGGNVEVREINVM